jgi:hypothetical protein
MSTIEGEIIEAERDKTTGRFLIGHKAAGPGRPRGARSKFSEAFIQDLHAIWERRGAEVLERVIEDDPSTFLRVCGMLMPKDISLTVGIDAASFVDKFKTARAMLGNEEPPRARPAIGHAARHR